MDLATWSRPATSGDSDTRPQQLRSPVVAGLVGTFLLHTLVLQSVLLGSQAHKVHPPKVQGPGATLIRSDAEPTENLVLIELPTAIAASKPLFEDLASAGSAPKNLVVTVLSPDPLPHVDIPQDALGESNANVASIDSGDPAARAALFGRYTGQIDARIERAWRRPRSPVNPDFAALNDANSPHTNSGSLSDDTFRCQVRILQNERGSVQEVQLLNCNGTVAWQHSLVVAILGSSPLPATRYPLPRVQSSLRAR